MISVLASSGTGHRALIVLGVIGIVVALTIVLPILGMTLQTIGDILDDNLGCLPVVIGGAVIAAVIGYIIGNSNLMLAGIVWALIAGALWGLGGAR